MRKINIKKIRIADLMPHEKFRVKHREELHIQIKNDKVLMRPIAVHELTEQAPGKYVIIDGHHRTQVLKRMGLTYIPANVMDYFSEDIIVRSWDKNKVWDKKRIVARALRGKLLKPKSTKHVFVRYGKEAPFQDNDYIEPSVSYPLSKLK